jgi:hypothetical protein
MWSTIIVFDQPGIEIGLKLVERAIDLLPKRDPVELIEHSAMKALADSVIAHDDFGALVSAASSANQERRWVEQGETAYARFVAGWNARGPKARTGAAKEERQ